MVVRESRSLSVVVVWFKQRMVARGIAFPCASRTSITESSGEPTLAASTSIVSRCPLLARKTEIILIGRREVHHRCAR